ncbi:MAG: hypothetical protein D4R83_01920 [Streptomycetaceae bacterium]|nr:MAG: hypothetical protein D4R83_01920 [Streptomycetaceae bacterium]
MKIEGFDHGSRGLGVRNYQLILPSVVCSTHISRRIANAVNAVTFSHQHGCGIIGADVAGIGDFFASLADHPNVSSVLIISLGCETIQGQELAEKLVAKNVSTKYQIIQDSGGVEATVTAGTASARSLQDSYPAKRIQLKDFRVGIDAPSNSAIIRDLIGALRALNIQTDLVSGKSPADSFSHLMEKKVHLILSFPTGDQPASGFPLIPVINIASESALHQAISADFDLPAETTVVNIVKLIFEVANGQETIAETNKSGEILAPRLVRST